MTGQLDVCVCVGGGGGVVYMVENCIKPDQSVNQSVNS